MRAQRPNVKSQSGQLIVEAVLIMVALFGVSFAVATYFRKNEILKTMVSGPWLNLSGMLQNGVWSAPSAGVHPAANDRHVSIEGEKAK